MVKFPYPHRTLALAAAALALLGSSSAALAQTGQDQHPAFVTQLLTSNEVPPAASLANGYAALLVSADGSTVYYTVVVTDASTQVTASHIHCCAPAGQNAPVVIPFCGTPTTPACGSEGVVAEGSFTQASFGATLQGASLGDLIDAIRAGNVYVNVHTTKYPGGEARGQLMDPSATPQAAE